MVKTKIQYHWSLDQNWLVFSSMTLLGSFCQGSVFPGTVCLSTVHLAIVCVVTLYLGNKFLSTVCLVFICLSYVYLALFVSVMFSL